jgi:murein DD-endopeptidase MepM/ murein hydrolase activator NlpD
MGTPVLAAYPGEVATADWVGGYGLMVVLRHLDGTQESRYAHLSEIAVKPGERVEQGTVIGRAGSTGLSTGPHLHFEWRHLTERGWTAVDAGLHLEFALENLLQKMQVATVPDRG